MLPFTRTALAHLGIAPAAPDLSLLRALLAAYARRVPWESASRIARRAHAQKPEDAANWPDTFWEGVVRDGTGGTCFESNYAFFAVLRDLGFEGYLTINDMRATCSCHTAIIVKSGDQRYIADVGYPIHTPLLIDAEGQTVTDSALNRYTVRSVGSGHYEVERTPHPFPYLFTLIDQPISDDDYRTALTADYGENGLFLDRVVINKVIDKQQWRFDGGQRPFRMEYFENGTKTEVPILENPARALNQKFGIAAHVLEDAFAALNVH